MNRDIGVQATLDIHIQQVEEEAEDNRAERWATEQAGEFLEKSEQATRAGRRAFPQIGNLAPRSDHTDNHCDKHSEPAEHTEIEVSFRIQDARVELLRGREEQLIGGEGDQSARGDPEERTDGEQGRPLLIIMRHFRPEREMRYIIECNADPGEHGEADEPAEELYL